jgi:alanine dehydrogenase
MAVLWLGEADVEALVDPVALVDGLAQAFANLATRFTECEAARIDRTDGATGYLSVFPAVDGTGALASAKVLAGRPANAAEGRPEIDAVLVAAEPATGRIAAILSARRLTAYRTAGVTALALRHLGVQGATVALAGTGLQARTHARVLLAMGIAKRILVASASRGEEVAKAFVAGLPPTIAERSAAVPLEAMAARGDVLVTLSLAARPLPLGPLQSDAIVVGVGPFYPHAHELDPVLVAAAEAVISDHPERLRRQWAGHAVAARPLLGLDDLASLRAEAPATGLRVVLSDGRAFEDNVAAQQILAAARAAGSGITLP